MSAATNDQLRYQILEILYKSAQDNVMSLGLERASMIDILKVPEKRVDFNIFYLRDKRLIELMLAGGEPWICAKITALGIDVIEHQDNFKTQLPFIQTNIQNIQGNVNAPVTQAVGGSQVTLNQQVTNAFSQANTIVEDRAGLSGEQKEEIKNYLKQIQEELGNKEPDAGKIQTLWKWLKQNANWIVPTLATVVLEGTKKAMGE